MKKYQPKKIESKWQRYWEKEKLNQARDFSKKPKQYLLIEFPYPSGQGLHVGHVRSYTALDVLVRQKRMAGYNVLYPIGWDAFGLPAENYAIKSGLHPQKVTARNIKVFKRQIKSLGISFDWSREIKTTDPQYYKWTQWIFLQFFKKGLAYQKEMPINWCPVCQIGLANEEVVEGRCERCGAQAERRLLKQWLLRITQYADRLIKDLAKVDYPEKVKNQQINWIGRSQGTEIDFKVKGGNQIIKVFTTRPETIFGVTALAIAPEHALIKELVKPEQQKAVEKYIKASQKKSEFERVELAKEKTGVFTGSYCLNPVNQEPVSIWVSDFVIGTYGSGAVMVVPAHDQRDYQFAKKYQLKIKPVIKGGELSQGAYLGHGQLINSGQFSGLSSKEAIKEITNWLVKRGLGRPKVSYKLRDWIFSRQHYWGEPIPIIHCPQCGPVAVPEKDLPVKLPYLEKYQPSQTGQSPLVQAKRWLKVKCPQCGQEAQRETDTMPNWAGSSWYYLRYTDPVNAKELAAMKKLKYWLPVDLYNGGMEHTNLHLLYSRFWHKFLYDLGLVPTDEPYRRRISHGFILAEDGRKMSKSFNNVVRPDEVIEKYGADTLRLYELFIAPYDQTTSWSTQGVRGAWRFLNRFWLLFHNRIGRSTDRETLVLLHQTIKRVSQDLENFKFNTAIAALMEFVNHWSADKRLLAKKEAALLLRLVAPLVPHLAEEIWQEVLAKPKSIFLEKWPSYDPRLIKEKTFLLLVQINGRLRDKFEVPLGTKEPEIKKMVLARPKIKKWLDRRPPRRFVYIANRLVNLVV